MVAQRRQADQTDKTQIYERKALVSETLFNKVAGLGTGVFLSILRNF